SGFAANQAIADADPIAAGNQPAAFGVNAFASVNAALTAANGFSGLLFRTVTVNAGAYAEDVVFQFAVPVVVQQAASFGSIAGGAAASVSLAGVPLTVGGSNASTLFAGSISGDGSLVKTGSGVLDLTGVNAYAGGATISAGSLLV